LGSKVVAIHQPTFFPWLGYFNKIARADLFIVLDNVQFSKKGGTWGNRVKLLVGGEPAWVTMPVVRNYHGVRNYAEMLIDNQSMWREKLLKTIETNYRRAPYFAEVFPQLAALINNPTARLTEYNLSAIIWLARAFQIDVSKLILGSTLRAQGSATDLLVSMVKAVDGTSYLCGGGAGGYQEDERFREAGLKLIYQGFEHPVYEQAGRVGEFSGGLSVIDALMNCGFEKTGMLITGGVNRSSA
jgi:hypothetical protein